MIILSALILSVYMQLGAFVITVSLIKKTKFNIAWISISLGLFLIFIRRLVDLYVVITATTLSEQELFNSWLAVVISTTLFVASFYIRKIFSELARLKQIRLDNESNVFSAIIQTEEKERKYFATELHDGLGPILSSIKMALSAINTSLVGDLNKQILQKTEHAVDSAIETTKEISNHLNPHLLERFGLEKAIITFVDHVLVDETFEVVVETNINESRYSYNLEVSVYRIVCELINNTIKHAGASAARIFIFAHEDKMEFVYDDNGKGFDCKQTNMAGHGLINITSRVKSLNGTFVMESKAGTGIYVKIELPL